MLASILLALVRFSAASVRLLRGARQLEKVFITLKRRDTREVEAVGACSLDENILHLNLDGTETEGSQRAQFVTYTTAWRERDQE